MQLQSLLAAGINVYIYVIVAKVLFSWLPARHRQNEVYRFLVTITDPVLAPFRRLLPPMGGLDFSPIVAIVLLDLIRRAVAP